VGGERRQHPDRPRDAAVRGARRIAPIHAQSMEQIARGRLETDIYADAATNSG
jgi:hypothetical protein